MSNENIVFKFDAQTAQAIASLTKLQASMGGIGDAATKAEQKTNTGLDRMTAGLIKFQGTIFAAEKGVQLLGKALEFGKFSEEMEKFGKVVSDNLVDKIQAATGGVVSQTQIMRQAAMALTGDMKLTEAQITDVFKASKNLADRGFGDTAENADKLFKSLRKGTNEALKEFGVAVNDGKTGAEKFRNAMTAIQRTAADTSGLDSTSNASQRLEASLTNLADSMKLIVGPVIASLADGLSGLIEKINELTDLSGGRSTLGRSAGMASIKVADEMARKYGTSFTPKEVYAIAAGEKGAAKEYREFIKKRFDEFESPVDKYMEADAAGAGFVTFSDKSKSSTGSSRRSTPKAGPTLERDSDRLSDSGSWSRDTTISSGVNALGAGTARQSSLSDLFPGTTTKPASLGFGDGFKSGFGEVRQEMDNLNSFGADAADLTKNAINASLQAAISGQMSIAKATKAALAQGLMAKAQVWGFEGVGAMILGSPVQGAKLLALAAAATIAARAMSSSAGGAGAAKPGGGYAGAGMGAGFGGQGYSGPQSVSIYTRGRGEQSVVQFDRAYRDAKARGYIPPENGPARLVG